MKKLIGLLCLFVIVLAGCSSASGETFVYGVVTSNIESLDVTKASYDQTITLFSDIYSGLTKINPDGEVELSEAEAIDISDDGLVYTIKIKPGLKWVDNTGAEMGEVTANDYVFAYQRMVDPASAALYGYIFENVLNANAIMAGEKTPDQLGVKAIDDYTLEITLENPAPYFKSMLAFQMFVPQPKAAYEKYGDTFATDETTTWYNGPYYVTSYDTDYIVSETKNPLYYNASNVEVENIDYRLVEDSNAAYNAFTNGELDYVEIGNQEIYTQAKKDGIVGDRLTGFSFYSALNMSKGANTENSDLRKALAYGFDRDSYVKTASGGRDKAIEYLIPEGVTPTAYDGVEYRDYSKDSLITYDKEKADQYFDSYMKTMGYTDRSQIQVIFLASDNGSGSNTGAEIVQSMYKQNFGIDVQLEIEPFEQMVETAKTNAWDMYITGWGPDYPDPSTYIGLFQSVNVGSMNYPQYANAQYDADYTKANKEQDTETRFKEFAALEKQLIDENAVIPIYQKNAAYLLDEEYDQPQHLFFKISHEYLTTSGDTSSDTEDAAADTEE